MTLEGLMDTYIFFEFASCALLVFVFATALLASCVVFLMIHTMALQLGRVVRTLRLPSPRKREHHESIRNEATLEPARQG